MAAMQTLAYDSLQKNPEKVEDSSYNSVLYNLKSATPFPKCYLHKEKWTFDS